MPDGFSAYISARNTLAEATTALYNALPTNNQGWVYFKSADNLTMIYMLVTTKQTKSANNLVYDITLTGPKITIVCDSNNIVTSVLIEDSATLNVPLTKNTSSPADDLSISPISESDIKSLLRTYIRPMIVSM